VTEVLVAYLHRRAPKPAKPQPTANLQDLRTRAPDVHAALVVLGRREVERSDPRLDLRDLGLHGANLIGANLSGAILVAADLRRALLRDANLHGANLVAADLRGATADQDTLWPAGFDWQGAGLRPTRRGKSGSPVRFRRGST
jgi:uncharacterized protein YjbI with pentapeptide repeats